MYPPCLKTCLRAATVVLGAALIGPGTSQAAAPRDAVPGELIVKFAPGADGGDRAAARDDADVALERALPVPGTQLVKADPGQSADAAAAQLERSPDIVYAEPNLYRNAAAVPNDSSFGSLWGSSNTGQSVQGTRGTAGSDIDARDAWDLTTGSPSVTAAVIDSGVAMSHPDLSSQIWTNPGETGAGRETNGVDDDHDGYVDDTRGWDFVQDDNDPTDQEGHGTHVSGTIAATGNNGRGVTGISWNSRVMPLRVLDANGSGTVADLITAYRYAAARGVKVVNLSLTGSSFSTAERDAIAAAPNTLFVVAAGNGGTDQIGDSDDAAPQYPCSYPLANIVCVAASDQRDGRASFSNYGAASVDLAAPGVNILSTVPGDNYAYYNGTSMATPQVTGAAALIWSLRPAESVAGVKSDLLSAVDARPAFAGITVSGGRLNVYRSLLQQYVPPPAAAPAPSPTPPAVAKAPPRAKAAAKPPRLYLKVASRQRIRSILSHGLPLATRCSKRCRVTVRLVAKSRTANHAHRSRVKLVTVGRATITLSLSRKRVVIKLSRAGRKLLKSHRSSALTVRAVASDSSGSGRRVDAPVALRR